MAASRYARPLPATTCIHCDRRAPASSLPPQVRWLPTVSSDFTLNIRCNGIHVQGSPFVARATNGAIDPTQSTLVDVPERVAAGEVARFRVEARDQMANLASYPPLHRTDYAFRIAVSGPSAGASRYR